MENWKPKIEKIVDPIAEDRWSIPGPNDTFKTIQVSVGRPVPLKDNTDWYCPVFIENYVENKAIYGVGPVDALMNAMTLVKSYFDNNPKTSPNAEETNDESKKP